MPNAIVVYGADPTAQQSATQVNPPLLTGEPDGNLPFPTTLEQLVQVQRALLRAANPTAVNPVAKNVKTLRTAAKYLLEKGIENGILPVKGDDATAQNQTVHQTPAPPRVNPNTTDPILLQLAALAALPHGGLAVGSTVFVQVGGQAIPVRVTPALIRRLQQVTGDPMILPMTRRDP